jgi:hypothetical protein
MWFFYKFIKFNLSYIKLSINYYLLGILQNFNTIHDYLINYFSTMFFLIMKLGKEGDSGQFCAEISISYLNIL